MPRRDQLARDGVEAPSDVEEAVAEHDVDRAVAPTNDVMRKAVRDELSLGTLGHRAGSSNRCGESACASLDEGLPAMASAIELGSQRGQ